MPARFFAMPAKARPPSPRIARTKPVRSCLVRTNAAMDISRGREWGSPLLPLYFCLW